MTDRYDDILARLRAATGPNREIDEAVFEVCHGRKRHRSISEQYDPSEELPRYTASIDAALAVVEKMLSPHLWAVHKFLGAKPYHAEMGSTGFAYAINAPIAILLALFKALEVRDRLNDHR